MEIKFDPTRNNGERVRVNGDLGVVLVTEDSSDSDTEKQSAIDTLSTLPGLQNSSAPVFGSVSVSESENVHFGNNTYFNGPVTIKQIIKTKSGIENESYTKDGDEDGRAVPPSKENSVKPLQVLPWNKLAVIGVCVGIVIIIVVVTLTVNQPTEALQKSGVSNSTCNTVYVVWSGFFQAIIVSVVVNLTLIMFIPLLIRGLGTVKENKVQQHKAGPMIISPAYLRIVNRSDWLSQPAEGPLDPLRLPAPWVIITHTATEACDSQSQCILRVRSIQTYHIESKGWYDIAYNFLVGGDGSVYYGRGWDYMGSHTQGYNKYSIAIAFIGTFNTVKPPKRQVEAAEKLIKIGVQYGKIAKDYKLLAHRQLMSTLSPGDAVFDIIQTWPHFVSNFTSDQTILPNY
ncbi:unnamed protein product [Leptosia nina]|uniref:Peptidoglycan recognition protein n=1 Tax=Leptosia nina TaxID=320188 RepID=A0AAV1K225_9NEOP